MYENKGLQKPSKAWDLLQLTRIVDYELLSDQNAIISSSCAKSLSFKDAPRGRTRPARDLLTYNQAIGACAKSCLLKETGMTC